MSPDPSPPSESRVPSSDSLDAIVAEMRDVNDRLNEGHMVEFELDAWADRLDALSCSPEQEHGVIAQLSAAEYARDELVKAMKVVKRHTTNDCKAHGVAKKAIRDYEVEPREIKPEDFGPQSDEPQVRVTEPSDEALHAAAMEFEKRPRGGGLPLAFRRALTAAYKVDSLAGVRVTEEAVEEAARRIDPAAFGASDVELYHPTVQESARSEALRAARAILEAALPHLAVGAGAGQERGEK